MQEIQLTVSSDLEATLDEVGLPPERLHGLVKGIFHDCSSVRLESFGKRGKSGAILIAAQGIKRQARVPTMVCILKISRKEEIEREFKNYTDFVQNTQVQEKTPVTYAKDLSYVGEWGAMAYSKVGGSKINPLRLEELYSSKDFLWLAIALNKLFNDLMQPWIESRELQRNVTWHEAYRMTQDKVGQIKDYAGDLMVLQDRRISKYAKRYGFNPIESCLSLNQVRCTYQQVT